MQRFTVADLLRVETFGQYFGDAFTCSPDGSRLAFVVLRGRETVATHRWPDLWGHDRADVWVVDLPDGTPRNLTNGMTDDGGYWAPVWSPDGRYLALLAMRGNEVTLWLWDQTTGQLRQLLNQMVNFGWGATPHRWVTPDQLVCPVLPHGERPWPIRGSQVIEQLPQAWAQAGHGAMPTASILESGAIHNSVPQVNSDLLLLNVVDGTVRTLATGVARWSAEDILATSPDGQWVAFLQATQPYRPEPGIPLGMTVGGQYRYTLRVVAITGAEMPISPITPQDVVPGSLCWARNGAKLAFLSYSDTRAKPPRIYCLHCDDHRLQILGSGNLDVASSNQAPKLRWSAQGDLVVYAAPSTDQGRARPDARRDWWLVAAARYERNLTSQLTAAPMDVFAVTGSAALVGIATGALWRLRTDGKPAENLTPARTSLTAIAWPQVAVAAPTDRALVTTEESGQRGYVEIDLTTGTRTVLSSPAPTATVVSYDPTCATTIFATSDDTGTFLWATHATKYAPALLFRTNKFLTAITPGERQRFTYQSLDNAVLTSWLLLPPGYQPGTRSPLVVYVYPGTVYGEAIPSLTTLNDPHSLNLQLLAAQGYVVLLPSMPLGPNGVAGDPLQALLLGVLPAVEHAVELGFADPARIFLMGHSFGAYGVYGLLTLTQRFRAAIAIAGFSNLTSCYGAFDTRLRYCEDAAVDLFWTTLFESDQGRMGSPPWQDSARYVRNSPVFFADQVETPLLIIHGDLDYVPIQQAEEFFVSLYRQGKRARYVRYWGETHLLANPANIKSMWQHILNWLHEYS